MRVFIHNVDTFLGRALVAELRKADEGYHRIFGTVAKSRENAPAKVKRILSRDDPKGAKKMLDTIQSCSLIVIDLFNSSMEDIHFLLQALKVDMKQTPPKPPNSDVLEQAVTVVLISSVMVWADTPSSGGALREADWQSRKPVQGSKYEQWRDIEDMVLTIFNQEESQIKGFVVAGGALYGEGEDTFARLFKDAWCGTKAHQIRAPGSNRIPMVHVRDLSRLVRQLAFYSPELSPMETPYFLAVDQPPYVQPPEPEPVAEAEDPSAGRAEEGAGEGEQGEGEQGEDGEEDGAAEDQPPEEGAGEEEAEAGEEGGEGAEDEEAPQEEQLPKSKPCTQAEIVQGVVDEMADHYDVPFVEVSEEVQGDADGEFPDARDVMAVNLLVEPSKIMLEEEFAAASEPPGWWCREGMLVNVRKIANEFCTQRNLRAVRVVVAGPPSSGKTTLCRAISEHFRIPCIPLDPADPEGMTSRLSGNVCRYRGFVLDAGGAGHDEVEKVFCYDAEIEKGEDEEEEAEPPAEEGEEGEEGQAAPPKPKTERRVNAELCPTFIIVTQATEPLCRARFTSSRASSKGSEASFEQRAKAYQEKNLTDGQPTFVGFFQDTAKMGVLNLPIAGKDTEEMFESARIYIERAGRPFNYLPSEADVTAQILKALAEKERKAALQVKDTKQKSSKVEEDDDEKEMEERREELIEMHLEEQARLNEMPLREYLMTYMIPTLTEGLIEMCKVLPDNPADYLAEFVEQHAAEGADQH